MSGQTGMRIVQRHIVGAFENLNNGFIFIDFYDTSQFLFFAVYCKFHNLFVCGIFYALQNHQRTIDFT